MRHLFLSPFSLLILVLLPIAAIAQDESVVTAREHYIDALNAAQAVASDVQLILVTNGADVILQGEAHNWSYYFKSASLNNVLLFVYEQDDESVKRVTPVRDDVLPIRLHTDLPTIPASWIDSNVALPEADAHGGNDYRAASNYDNYHIGMVLLPPSDGGRTPLFDRAAWLVGYTGDIGELNIPVDAATGMFLDFGVATARRFLEEADSLANTLGNDLALVAVSTNLGRPDGSAPFWTYYFLSSSQSKFFGVIALEGRLGIVQEPINEGGLLQFGMPVLPSGWADSDMAIEESEQRGGSAFRQSRNEWQISASIRTWDLGLPQWHIDYNSPTGSEHFVVDAVESNPVTARDKLDEILTMATQHYADAELVVVNSSSLVLTGLSNQWSYFFKSVNTPDIFELKVLGGEVSDVVYPFGLNGHLDLFMEPIPYVWVDSDEAIAVAEQNGGSEFRQTHADWKIVPEMRVEENGWLEWHFDYQSPTGATIFVVDAVVSNPVTARHLLSEVLAAALQELGESQLVAVSTSDLDLEGRANEWSYFFTSPGSSNLSEVTVRSGEVDSTLTPIPPDELLRLDLPALPDEWMDSDSALAIVEQIGGSEFRQTHPNVEIDLLCAWQERGPTRARNLGERPMYSVLYESDTGDRFRRAVDLEFGAYSAMATTTAQEPLATLTDSVEAAELPDDAALVNVMSTNTDYMGYADHWVYLYESPVEDRQYEFRALGGHVLRLDSVRSMVGKGQASLPADWIDSPLALKVAEQDGGTDFRDTHPDYNIVLDLRSSGEGVFWDVLYESGAGPLRFTVDALDFSVPTETIDLPGDGMRLQTYPNPFSGAVNVAFTLPLASNVSLDMYDILGRKRMTVLEAFLPAGSHTIPLAAKELATGHYFLVLSAGNQVLRGGMVTRN